MLTNSGGNPSKVRDLSTDGRQLPRCAVSFVLWSSLVRIKRLPNIASNERYRDIKACWKLVRICQNTFSLSYLNSGVVRSIVLQSSSSFRLGVVEEREINRKYVEFVGMSRDESIIIY